MPAPVRLGSLARRHRDPIENLDWRPLAAVAVWVSAGYDENGTRKWGQL
jgi:hypothetical protein